MFDNWDCCPDNADVYVTLSGVLGPSSEDSVSMVWSLVCSLWVPLRAAPGTVETVTRHYNVPCQPFSIFKARKWIMTGLMWRDLMFLMLIRGTQWLLLTDSSPVGNGEHVVSFLAA